ncbi:MAG TPA: hemerythrin domain-containing protein [Oxalicibacterium sp.]|nr:hemerythrin domain-containing protein [Oxalicibacterium sp.]
MTAHSGKSASPDQTDIDALALLLADHKEIRKLFKEFARLSAARSQSAKVDLALHLCETWTLHAALEQEILYPAARAALTDEHELINQLDVHYAGMRELISRIQLMDGSEHLYDATLAVLQEYIEQHIAMEEKTLFPKARKAKMHLHRLARTIAERKDEQTVELA